MVTGRGGEVAQLGVALGHGAPVAVVGPAGIGKTTVCRAALGAEGTFRETGALATLRRAPLHVFRRLLDGAERDDPAGVVAQVLRLGPVGLLLDDLQWADDLSLEVAGMLAGRVPLLVTVRTGDPGTEAAQARLEDAGFELRPLGPLDQAASIELLDAARPELPPARRLQVLTQAAGNPLLLTELAESGEATPTLVRALQARLRELSAEVHTAMARLGVLGRPTEPSLLGPGADGLVAAGLATFDGGLVVVRHALLGEAVVASLGEQADELRRDLALQVGPGEGAFLAARSGDQVTARRLALAAAADATSRLVGAEMQAFAVACAPEGDLDVELRLTAARALSGVGQAVRALELCLVPGLDDLDPSERGGLLAVAAEAAWLAGQPARFADLIARALEDVRGSRSALEVQVLAGSTFVETRIGLDGRPALERAEAAVALADEIGQQQGFARYRLASVLLTSGRTGWAELYRRVVAAAEQDQDHGLRLSALESLVLGEWVSGSIDAAVQVADEVHDQGPPAGFEAGWLGFVAYGSLLSVLAGGDRQAVIDRWAPRLRDEPLFRNRAYAASAVALAAADLGRQDEAVAVLAEHRRTLDEDLQLLAVAGWAEAEVAWAGGRSRQALEALATVEALGLADHPASISARLIGGHTRWDLGQPIVGDEPAPTLPAWAAATHEWRGLVAAAGGNPETAVGHFDRAAEAWAGHDRRGEARATWAAAEAARIAGRADAPGRLLVAERRAVDACVGGVVARCRRSLRSTGVGRGASRGRGVAGLTVREEEILRRVGAGLTTAQIAEELHIARSTVDSLVRSAVRRLGVANRKQAAVVASQAASPSETPAADR